MAPMITAGLTRRGKPNYRDKNNFYYVFNGERAETKNWRCSQRSCTATLTTRISTGNLVGDVLPTHGHTNKLLKTKAKTTEKAVIEKYANVQGALPSNVLQEISQSMLNSDFPGQIISASSKSAIKMKLWRQKQIINPRPELPKSFEEYMNIELPTKFTQAADGGEFMFHKDWVDNERTQPLVMFMSRWSADILKTHSVWLFDGTFKSAPPPFSQVKYLCEKIYISNLILKKLF